MEGQDWACSACKYPCGQSVFGRAGMGNAEHEAGPLMTPEGTGETPANPRVRAGLMGCGQLHSSSSSDDCGGCGAACSGAGGVVGCGSNLRWDTSASEKPSSLGEWRGDSARPPPPSPPISCMPGWEPLLWATIRGVSVFKCCCCCCCCWR